jgi:hypothetical protein
MAFHGFDHGSVSRDRRQLKWNLLGTCLLALTASSTAAAPAPVDPQPIAFNACTIFSAADAASVLGVPVRPITSVGGCSYEAAKETSSGWRRNVGLTVFKYNSAADEASAWGDQKILHHFEPGRKNLTIVSGIGSETFLEIMPDRNAFDGRIWVHKNLSHFVLSATSEQSPSPEALKAAAQKIAAKLP